MCKQLLYLVFCVCLGASVTAQDTHFSQFYANPLHLNPALAGTQNDGRLGVNYRKQWAAADNAFSTLAVGYDQFSTILQGGWGIRLESDRQMGNTLTQTSVSGTYAYRITLSHEAYIQAGLQGGYTLRRLDRNELIFEDQLDSQAGLVQESAEQRGIIQYGAPIFAAGALVMHKRWWGGASANYLGQFSTQQPMEVERHAPYKVTVHGGTEIETGPLSDWTILPNLMFQYQAASVKTNIGLYAQGKAVTVGTWLRSFNAMTILIGWHFNRFSSGYSYDIDLGSRRRFGGAHEISLIWELDVPRTSKKPMSQRFQKCPRF